MSWRLFVLASFIFAPFSSWAISGFTENEPAATFSRSCFYDLVKELNKSDKVVATNDFVTHRAYDLYQQILGTAQTPALAQILDELPQNAVIFDFGAGEAKFHRQLLRSEDFKGKFNFLVSSSFNTQFEEEGAKEALEIDRAKFKDRFAFIETGDLEAALHNPNHPLHDWEGQVDFFSEVWGPTSYLDDLNIPFEWIARLLKVGRSGLINFPFDTKIFYNGARISIDELKLLLPALTKGRLSLVDHGMSSWKDSHVLWLKRIDVQIPEKDQLQFKRVKFISGTPPTREISIIPRPITKEYSPRARRAQSARP